MILAQALKWRVLKKKKKKKRKLKGSEMEGFTNEARGLEMCEVKLKNY